MRSELLYPPLLLTRHSPRPLRYLGYTSMDWMKMYGFTAGVFFWVVFTYTHYFELFNDIESALPGYQRFVLLFTLLPLVLLTPAVLGFFWWAAGALVRYSIWQLRQPELWRWFWMVQLVFFGIIEFDPLDHIHPEMSRKGLGLAPNLLKLYDGKLEFFQFQWGYFLLWALFWFLIVILHWSYLQYGIKVVWFYTKRFNRYGASILTGFRETMAMARSEPVTVQYPSQRAPLPATFRGVPRLAIAQITPAQAAAIIAADSSRSITAAPDQPTVLFVDLGSFNYDPALAEVRDDAGQPLLAFDAVWALPAATRERLVVPLARPQAAQQQNTDLPAESGEARA